MSVCKIHGFLAYAMAAYCLASIYYLVRTRSVGTPFKDSLTKEQRVIKKKSAGVRKRIFVEGLVGGGILLMLFTPFKRC